MPIIIGESEIQERDLDARALRVFLKALELLGGPRKLIELRNLTWVTSLMEASYAVILAEEGLKTEDEIASFLGLTRQTVRNILRADPELVMMKLEGELREKTPKAHTAGGLAKLAYREIKEGRDALIFFSSLVEEGARLLGVGWPAEVLARLKGLHFPVAGTEIGQKLKGLKVKEKDLGDIAATKDIYHHPREILQILSEALRD
ncbi:MAG TPA: bacterio-opsin activator [Thermodesulfobacteriaceae bacterium]|nr:bacterio-opsin activator [Thermodesulfobacteriaceae bacterium]